MEITNSCSKASWKSASIQEGFLKKLFVAHMGPRTSVCSSHGVLDNLMNTTEEGLVKALKF
jgi:hypothetical protein